jgi:hypothetical protein
MNPETKAVLEALTKRFESLEASVKESGVKWEKGFAESSEKWEKGFAEAAEHWECRFHQVRRQVGAPVCGSGRRAGCAC